MFTQLFDVVFPSLGDIFGTICGLANTPLDIYIRCFSYGGAITYTNLITGIQSVFWIDRNILFEGAIRLAFVGVPSNYALWLACLYNVIRVFFVVSIVRFLGSLL